MKLGEKLQQLRKKSGLSQEQLADRLGVTRQSVSKWESGAAAPELGKLIALSDIFSVSVDYLVCVDAPKMLDVSKLDEGSIALIAALVKKLTDA